MARPDGSGCGGGVCFERGNEVRGWVSNIIFVHSLYVSGETVHLELSNFLLQLCRRCNLWSI